MVQKKITLYQAIGDQAKEKVLLQNALTRYPNWDFAVQRLKEIEMSSRAAGEVIQSQILSGSLHYIRDDAPSTKEEILALSYQYQKEWRFERDKQLMEQALTQFPDWDYIHKRLEWHSRPIFHRDPEKSKTQPRKPLHLPRDPNYIPKQETLDSLCFVTGTSSNAPYFELAVQLIESIKATRWYNNIPIKVLDCGLTEDDANYLRERFGCEVKDPGWDVDPEIIEVNNASLKWSINPNAFKNMTAVHCLHKHFPSYQYYVWMDCDMWIQDENVLNRYITICEQQGICGSLIRYDNIHHSYWQNILSEEQLNFLSNKNAITGGFWVINQDFSYKYEKEMDKYIKNRRKYTYGSNDSILSYTLHKYINDPIIPTDENLWPYLILPVFSKNAYIDENLTLKINNQIICSLCVDFFGYKKEDNFYRCVFSKNPTDINLIEISKELSKKDPIIAEEEAHQLCIQNGWQQGNYFYRIYPKPEEILLAS